MVEGHSVHRLASRFASKLVGRRFTATSPNGRFAEGASAIDGRVLSRMEAVGKNLFAFFGSSGSDADLAIDENEVVVHVHFGMSGVWAIYDSMIEGEPETKPTTRLRLEEITTASNATANSARFVTHLSAMTVTHGPPSLYASKKATLGQDPLRSDANPTLLYKKLLKTKKSIGQCLMEQSLFAGPGNIYRAEILFLAGIYPTMPANQLDLASFTRLWNVTVKLLRRGYDTGSILTVDAEVDPNVAARGERRYIYNRSNCARCGSSVSSWDMGGRTCYACEGGVCQPKIGMVKGTESASSPLKSGSRKSDAKLAGKGNVPAAAALTKSKKAKKNKQQKKKQSKPEQHVPFISHCAPISHRQRLEQGGSQNLTIAEIRSEIEQIILGNNGTEEDVGQALPPKIAKKAVHVQALDNLLNQQQQKHLGAVKGEKDALVPLAAALSTNEQLPPPAISAEEAAREKASSGENRAVEHIAELSREQAVKAIALTATPNGIEGVKEEVIDNKLASVTPSPVAVPSKATRGAKKSSSTKEVKKRVNRKRDSACITRKKSDSVDVSTPKRRSTRRRL